MSSADEDYETLQSHRPAKKRKRKKKVTGAYFLDVEAGSDDEASADDHSFIHNDSASESGLRSHVLKTANREAARAAHEEESAVGRQNHAEYLALEQDREQAELVAQSKAIEERFRSKYGGQRSVGPASEGPRDYREIGEDEDMQTQQLLPSVRDPKLWKVNCVPSKERDCVLKVMQLVQKRRNKPGKQLFIKSAFTADVGKGYIYIEADKKVHVSEVAFPVQQLFQWKISLVPINEMVECMTTHDPEPDVRLGQWVRMRKGVYKNDVAQVLDLQDNGARIKIRVIPRLDIAKMSEGGSPFGFRVTKIPPARFFDPAEVRRHLEQVGGEHQLTQHHNGDWVFRSMTFRNGYLIRTVKADSLILDASPAVEEIEKFRSSAPGVDGMDAEDMLPPPPRKEKKVFRVDDTVKVIKGDLVNLTGKVVSVKGEKVMVMPNHGDLTEPLALAPAELQKYFTVGSHVKVMSGPFKDETGLIVRVDDDEEVISFFSDISSKQIRVMAQDVIETSEVSSGKDRLGQFELFDFVMYSRDAGGVIVQIVTDVFRILDQNGTIQQMRLQDLTPRRTRNLTCLDRNANQVVAGDIVRAISGEHQGTHGTVKHIFRNTCYLHSRLYNENSGIFVARARDCELTGARGSTRQSNKFMSGIIKNGGTAPPPFRRGRGRRDAMEGKTVKIISGNFKGYAGIVKTAQGDKLRIELHTENKVITVKRAQVKDIKKLQQDRGDREERRRRMNGAQTPLLGAQTPRYPGSTYDDEPMGRRSARLRTPGRDTPSYATPSLGGSKTPTWGSKTPTWGSKTPTWGSKTPAYGSQTPAYGNQTPAYGNQTPAYGNQTPGYGNQTPAYPAGSQTPGGVGSRTPGYGADVPLGLRTPGANDIWNVGAETPAPEREEPTDEPQFAPATPHYAAPPTPRTESGAKSPDWQHLGPTTPAPIDTPGLSSAGPMSPHVPGQTPAPSTPGPITPASPYISGGPHHPGMTPTYDNLRTPVGPGMTPAPGNLPSTPFSPQIDTPLSMQTPHPTQTPMSYESASGFTPKTPGLPITPGAGYTPTPITPHTRSQYDSIQTPTGDQYGSYPPQTPYDTGLTPGGSNQYSSYPPQTPGAPLTPATPAMTPGPYGSYDSAVPSTPFEPDVPATQAQDFSQAADLNIYDSQPAGGYSPTTPAAFTPNSPSIMTPTIKGDYGTPAAFDTPASMGYPATPSLSSVTSSLLPGYGSTSVTSGGLSPASQSAGSPGIEVWGRRGVVAVYDGREVTIVARADSDRYTVKIDGLNEDVPGSKLSLALPGTNDRVMVLRGEHMNRVCQVLSIDESTNEAIVSDLHDVISLIWLAKVAQL
eukprot:240793_1